MKTLTIKLPAELCEQFTEIVLKESGRWRNNESPEEALESAVAAALTVFMFGLGGRERLMELREYVLESLKRKKE